ncbi:hypothetical protein JTB14_027648 [Gonioctena quinquepunctata]|nr:hypothetical protein JTB14_027648 [Gonioctena quinquepunctata]
MSCFIRDCKNSWRSGKNPGNITFHKFPKNTYKQWLENIGVYSEIDWPKNKKICSDHFESDCFIRTGFCVRLKPLSKPTLFLPVVEECTRSESTITPSPPTTRFESESSVTVTSPENKYISASDGTPTTILKTLKRKLKVNSPKSSSTSSSTIRKQAKFVNEMHSYSCSMDQFERKYSRNKIALRKVRVKYGNTKRTVKKLKQKVQSLHCVINTLKKKQLISEMSSENLTKPFLPFLEK